MSDLVVEVQAFEGAGAALAKAAEGVNSSGAVLEGDLGHRDLAWARGVIDRAWSIDGPALHTILGADGQEASKAGAEFSRVDTALSGQATNGKA
ncbi:hypothetical protein J7E83_08800 [Arthrobacter sp. ISL-48]|uniref:hypothetical protein n=1 Tax=Arthrobacter sp. ISL-48 TaxID=2819110 RepID=UPI001BE59177|nr:hypothetical protein [Arthrobacter sp. ISL-48]MBT2532221.1 hypothetical protein [Arthrobacter sp. ISL-48]